MSLDSRLLALVQAVGSDVKTLRTTRKEIRILEVAEALPDPLPEGVIFFRKQS